MKFDIDWTVEEVKAAIIDKFKVSLARENLLDRVGELSLWNSKRMKWLEMEKLIGDSLKTQVIPTHHFTD